MMLLDIALIGVVIGIGTLGIFYMMMPAGIDYARTMAFATLVIFQMWNVINCKAGEQTAFKAATFNNVFAWLAIVISCVLLAAIIYIPFTRDLFGAVPLTLNDWGLILIWTLPVFIVVELRKAATGLALKTRDAGR
jgi:Ca2+-transporting ATPase